MFLLASFFMMSWKTFYQGSPQWCLRPLQPLIHNQIFRITLCLATTRIIIQPELFQSSHLWSLPISPVPVLSIRSLMDILSALPVVWSIPKIPALQMIDLIQANYRSWRKRYRIFVNIPTENRIKSLLLALNLRTVRFRMMGTISLLSLINWLESWKIGVKRSLAETVMLQGWNV